ncbi:MAG TPA: cobalamin biosynthesis protein [Oligoflexus sp.]|uniref:cobalt-precorrin 5A hydrolase n=1 Tax=Oligoflexus sp. TaxID=1971216 RepID=UPI002D391DFC|nr:cobalamin biosynthesis protein [Oligoflexus sp.]HYX35494.1 cobalamin biosynthesis protein [Oligoflexus sp.]
MSSKKKLAIHAITRHGFALAQRLQAAFPDSTLYVSNKISQEEKPGVVPVKLPLGPLLEDVFHAYETHVFIISVGAVVRMIAPHLRDKKQDPAVVCIDDAGQFAICLLSGHVGGGNRETLRIASALSCQPIITTASDVQGTLTVDILGRELGWVLEDQDHNVTTGCAAVVNERPVLIVQECGQPDFWPLKKSWPPGVAYTRDIDTVDPQPWDHILIISDRDIPRIYPDIYAKGLVFRPPTLWIGIGCDRDAPYELLKRGLQSLLQEFRLSEKSIAGLTSVDVKEDEPGLLRLCADYGKTLKVFSADSLDRVGPIQNPSEKVREHVGTRSVSEASCLLAAGASDLLVPKQKYGEAGIKQKMTLAIARQPFATREGVSG